MDPIKQARRLVVFVIGFTVLLGGVALLVLPGPAFVVIPIGLAILSTEFVWAKSLLKRVRKGMADAAESVLGSQAAGTVNSSWSKRSLAWLTRKRSTAGPGAGR